MTESRWTINDLRGYTPRGSEHPLGEIEILRGEMKDAVAARCYDMETAQLIAEAPALLAIATKLDNWSAWSVGFDLDKLPAMIDELRAMARESLTRIKGV